MEILHKNEVMVTDFKHIDVYEEYLRMKGEGAKVTYIVAILSAKYNLGERTLYRLISRMSKTAIF